MRGSIEDLLIVSDMDGTLLTDKGELLQSTVETIRLFVALGGKFAVATGRMTESVSRYTPLLNLMVPAITTGGAVIYDFKTKQVKHSALLPKMVSYQAVNDIMHVFPKVGILVASAENTSFYHVRVSRETQELIDDEKMSFFVRDIDDMPSSWNKMLCAGPIEMMPDVLEYLCSKSYPGVTFVATSKKYVEMMPQGTNKGSALLDLCKIVGVHQKNTIVFGDYYNDKEILEIAGLSIAVGNAPQEIKLIADEVIGTCNDGAVGQYIYGLIQKYTKTTI